ncbi:hypothetical protein ACFLRW_02050 [Acidobacteriota bacterium]
MEITIKEAKTRKDLKTFIYLPEKIHAGHKNWVHPIYMDEWKYFDAKKNKSFSYCKTVLLLAFKDGKAAGRIMGIINDRYNDYKNEKTVRFGYLETWEDEPVTGALLHEVEVWGRKNGMTKIVGPYGFTDQDPEGFLIEGFEHRATIATYYNYEWMPKFVEKLGYAKDIDYFVYHIEVPKKMPEIYQKIYDRAKKKGGYKIIEFKKKKEFKPWIKPILQLMNETYTASDIYGYTPLDEKEMEALAKRYMPVLDPRFVKAVTVDGEVISFVIAMPDMTEGIQKARGKLFPLGFMKILKAAKKTKQLDLLLGAIKESYRGRGLDGIMGVKMLQSAFDAEMEVLDTHHEMESNVKVRAEMIRIGGKLSKRFRIYKKELNP